MSNSNKKTTTVKYFSWGGEFKSTPEGILEGEAIVFGSPTKTDRSPFKDYFSPNTVVNPNEVFTVFLGYEHGFQHKGFIGEAKIYRAEGGWKVQAQLDLNNELVKAKLPEIMAGGWGFSTGAVGHYVDRSKKSNGSHHIDVWPVGEISITKTPAEPRALIHAVKCEVDYYDMEDFNEDQLPESEPDPRLNYMENLNGELQKVINMLIESLAKKTVDESFTPQIEEIVKSFTEQVDSLKEALTSIKEEVKSLVDSTKEQKPDEEELKELTVLKSLEEEKEALLREKAALLSENKTIEDLNTVVETQKTELESKEELIKSLEADIKEAKEDTLKEKEKNTRLAKSILN